MALMSLLDVLCGFQFIFLLSVHASLKKANLKLLLDDG